MTEKFFDNVETTKDNFTVKTGYVHANCNYLAPESGFCDKCGWLAGPEDLLIEY